MSEEQGNNQMVNGVAATPGFCPACGAPVEAEQAFCIECGAKLDVIAPADDLTAAEEPAAAEDPAVAPEPAPAEEMAGEDPVLSETDASAPVGEETVAMPVPAESAPASEEPAPVEPAPAPVQPQQSGKKTAVIIAVTAVIAVLLTAAALFFLQPMGPSSAAQDDTPQGDASSAVVIDGTDGGSADDDAAGSKAQDGDSTQDDAAADKDGALKTEPVSLTKSYTTRFEKDAGVTFPAFTFSYPSNWDVTYTWANMDGEQVVLTNQDDVKIEYMMGSMPQGGIQKSYEDEQVMADAAFVPSGVQGTDHSGLGKFVVARGGLATKGELGPGYCYALLPASSIADGSQPIFTHVPAWDYSMALSFTCMPGYELDAQTEREVVAILASFHTEGAAASASSSAGSPGSTGSKGQGTAASGDYILPESDSRAYSASELEDLSNYELFLARNEIFARHGRQFQSAELQEHFGGKSWYTPSVPASEFSEGTLNSHEKANAELIKSIEQSRGSQYL